jgi:hypothetical protein
VLHEFAGQKVVPALRIAIALIDSWGGGFELTWKRNCVDWGNVERHLLLRNSPSVTDKLPAVTHCLHASLQVGRGMCFNDVADCARTESLFDNIR